MSADPTAHLLLLGDLIRRSQKGPAHRLDDLVLAFPSLLHFLKRHQRQVEQAGLRRPERIAATRLYVELCELLDPHDNDEIDIDRLALLRGALEAFHLRAMTCIEAAFRGRPTEHLAFRGMISLPRRTPPLATRPRAAPAPTPDPPASASAPPRSHLPS